MEPMMIQQLTIVSGRRSFDDRCQLHDSSQSKALRLTTWKAGRKDGTKRLVETCQVLLISYREAPPWLPDECSPSDVFPEDRRSDRLSHLTQMREGDTSESFRVSSPGGATPRARHWFGDEREIFLTGWATPECVSHCVTQPIAGSGIAPSIASLRCVF